MKVCLMLDADTFIENFLYLKKFTKRCYVWIVVYIYIACFFIIFACNAFNTLTLLVGQ